LTKFYCSQKFWWLSVEPHKRVISSCCGATPIKVNLEWLKNNSGQLFNYPSLQEERQQMLNGVAVASCQQTCWQAEEQGVISRRQLMKSDVVRETDIDAEPSLLNINLGNDCNLTCSYCDKAYSTAWLRDINENGAYLNIPKFELTTNDKIVLELGQKTIKNSDTFKLLLNESLSYTNINKVEITGGEPFLFNGIEELINSITSPKLFVYTGLGINNKRFKEILTKIKRKLVLTVSAETIGKLYEFNRYGNTYANFITNLNTIKELGIDYHFSSVISNLTIHGYKEFQETHGTDFDVINFCTDPDYLNINVLDDSSKNKINQVKYTKYDEEIKKTLNTEYNVVQKENLGIFLTEFAKRRSLDLSIFPDTMKNWLMELKYEYKQ